MQKSVLVNKVAEWAVHDSDSQERLKDTLTHFYNSFVQRRNCVPAFLNCVEMAGAMSPPVASKFMRVAIQLFCSPDGIGAPDDPEHVQIFAGVFEKFDVDTLFCMIKKLRPTRAEHARLVLAFFRAPQPESTVFGGPDACTTLFRRVSSHFGAGDFMTALVAERAIASKACVMGDFVLAATRTCNFETVDAAVRGGRIDMAAGSCRAPTGTTFLCYLNDLNDNMFEKVLADWLPLCDPGHAESALADMARHADEEVYTPDGRDRVKHLGELKWELLLDVAQRPPYNEVAVAAVKRRYDGLFGAILQRCEFVPDTLKRICMIGVDHGNVNAIKHLLSRHAWLAKTYLKEDVGLLQYILNVGSRVLFDVGVVPELSSSLDVVDQRGFTPLSLTLKMGFSNTFMLLIRLGANLAFFHPKLGTVLHMLSSVPPDNLVWSEFVRWLRLSVEHRQRLPHLEMRDPLYGMTALQMAVEKEHMGMVVYLVSEGALLDTQFGKWKEVSLLDHVFLKERWEYVNMFHRMRGVEASVPRILHRCLDGAFFGGLHDIFKLPGFGHKFGPYKQDHPFVSRKMEDIVNMLKVLNGHEVLLENSTAASSDDKCSICKVNLVGCYVTPCGHRFHARCLYGWLHEHNTCPLCRTVQRVVPAKWIPGKEPVERPAPPAMNEVGGSTDQPPTTRLQYLGECGKRRTRGARAYLQLFVRQFWKNDRWVDERDL